MHVQNKCIISSNQSPTDLDDIVAPPVQYAVNGSQHTLQCEVEGVDEGVIVSWQRAGDSLVVTGPYTIETVRLSDEGQYICRVYYTESDVSTTKNVDLRVVGELN